MWNFYVDAAEPEKCPVQTQAELTLRSLLEKQLSTSNRLEHVEFQEATESMCCIGHSSSGVHTLAEFRENEMCEKQDDIYRSLSKGSTSSPGFLQTKKKRYGLHPLFVKHALEEEKDEISNSQFSQDQQRKCKHPKLSRHSEELEASLMRGKDNLKLISHLSSGVSSCRKPLPNSCEDVFYDQATPQERIREKKEKVHVRTSLEVFACRAPDVLDLHAYLEKKNKGEEVCHAENIRFEKLEVLANRKPELPKCNDMHEIGILKEEILSNKLSEEEIRRIQGKKFSNYCPGSPTCVLYIKNLSSSVTEKDLAALYLRFERPDKKLVFRLMQQGRMKGQAFVTFTDVDTAKAAFLLTNGYIFKGKPIVIQYGHGMKND